MTENKFKIGIIGMGPVGQIMAVHAQEAGYDIAICDIDKLKVNIIRKEGIHLSGSIKKSCKLENIFSSIADLMSYKPDVIIFSIKSYQLPHVINEIQKGDHEEFKAISAQNGIDTEKMLAETFGDQLTYRMVINYAGNLNAPNVVDVTFFNPPNYIAYLDDHQKEFATGFAEAMSSVKLDTEAITSAEMKRQVWKKTILNSSLSAFCGITRLNMKEVMDTPDSVRVVKEITRESVKVAEAEGVHFDDDFVNTCMEYLNKAGHHYPSLAVDLMNNQTTEIDYLNGMIVDYGKMHDIPTPANFVFTNTVKALTINNSPLKPVSGTDIEMSRQIESDGGTNSSGNEFYLGVDIGSAFTKITVVDSNNKIVSKDIINSLTRDKQDLFAILQETNHNYNIVSSCATGYGRENFSGIDMTKTELNCAATGVSQLFNNNKNIIDIGSEDIKVINSGPDGIVNDFYMNTKCASGTGAFIFEIAEKADIDLRKMSELASMSKSDTELNSFCTVFAKTEVMKWMLDDMPMEDIAKGIYISIINRISKIKVNPSLPIYLIGGVIAYHPYLREIISEQFDQEVIIVENPQFIVSFGAALMAKQKTATPTLKTSK